MSPMADVGGADSPLDSTTGGALLGRSSLTLGVGKRLPATTMPAAAEPDEIGGAATVLTAGNPGPSRFFSAGMFEIDRVNGNYTLSTMTVKKGALTKCM